MCSKVLIIRTTYIFQQFPLPQGKVSGGTFSINRMIYQRGSRHIYDYWASSGATGWSFREILKYFRRSEDISVPELARSSKALINLK